MDTAGVLSCEKCGLDRKRHTNSRWGIDNRWILEIENHKISCLPTTTAFRNMIEAYRYGSGSSKIWLWRTVFTIPAAQALWDSLVRRKVWLRSRKRRSHTNNQDWGFPLKKPWYVYWLALCRTWTQVMSRIQSPSRYWLLKSSVMDSSPFTMYLCERIGHTTIKLPNRQISLHRITPRILSQWEIPSRPNRKTLEDQRQDTRDSKDNKKHYHRQ